MIERFINLYKRMRTEQYLHQTYHYSYAFVGMGQHALANLYPVLHYLGVPLKSICVTSERKARLIERKIPGVRATTSLDEILEDETVKGVFVSASPCAHFSIASQVLCHGKSLFIEKPPCQGLKELDKLIELHGRYGSRVAMVGLQRRYAPAVQLLKERLSKERLMSYDLHYLTGAYPEGDALLELYIHAIDLVCHLFGKPEILVCRQVAKDAFVLMFEHPDIVGTLELSTSYTWTAAEESLKVCTTCGIYHLSQGEELSFSPHSPVVFGIPLEKISGGGKGRQWLLQRNRFVPMVANNPLYTQGFCDEMVAFVQAVEGGRGLVLTSLSAIRPTYETLSDISMQQHGNEE